MLGRAKKVIIDKDNTTIVDGAGKKQGDRGPRRPDQGADRGHHLGLRQGEAAGTSGQARRRRCGDPRRRRDRSRSEGEEGPRRRRAQRHPRGGRRRHRPRRRRRAAARQEGGRPPHQRQRRPAGRHRHRARRRWRRRSARSPRTPASKARSWSARSWTTSPRPTASTRRTEEYVDMVEAGIIDPAKVVRTALQDAASVAGLLVTTEADGRRAPKDGPGAGHAGRNGRRHGRHGRLLRTFGVEVGQARLRMPPTSGQTKRARCKPRPFCFFSLRRLRGR